MSSPFDYIGSISQSKKDIMDDESDYSAFMVNRGLSYFPDTIHYANAMNEHWEIDARLQYDFLRHAIRPRKRFSKWFKASQDADVDMLMRYYSISRAKALDALQILTKEQLVELRKKTTVGGKG